MKVIRKYKIILIISLLLILVISIFAIYKTNNVLILEGITETKKEQEKLELFSYIIYDSKDINNIKVLVAVNSENGIEYVKKPNGNIVQGHGKNKVTIDYKMSQGNKYIFEIKEKGNEEIKTKEINIEEDFVNNSLSIEKISENTGYKTIEIKSNINLSGFKTYYQIGKNGEWVEGKGKISILDYDVTTEKLINEDNTITINAKVKNSLGDIVETTKDFEVDPTATVASFEADSLIQAMEKYDFATGKFKVTVADQEYNLKVYSFEENQTIEANTSFGTESDVATESTDAQNMIVLKVNGDLTIEQEAILTSYASKNGYGGPKGMMIYCTGTLTNNGTISMTARGAKAEGQNVYMWKNIDESYEYVPAVGANGASAVYAKNGLSSIEVYGKKGSDGINRQTGGGASGGINIRHWTGEGYSGAGGKGTSYCGGTGGGAYSKPGYSDSAGGSGANNGGAGGNGVTVNATTYGIRYYAGSGAGNPTGKEKFFYYGEKATINGSGENGCGGLLIIYANTIKNNGQIQSNGSKGGLAKEGYNSYSAAGGSSGGGTINIFYKEQYESKGTILANGGVAVGSRAYGGAGRNRLYISRKYLNRNI